MNQDYSLEFFVKHEFGELYWANLKHFLSRFKLIVVPLALVLCAVGAILVYGSITHLHIAESRPDFISNLSPLLMYGAGAVVMIFALPAVASAKNLRDPRSKNGFTYNVSNDGVRVDGSAGRSENNWTAFVRATEARSAFSLFVTRDSFHLLPKRCFASSEDIDRFRTIIRTNVPATRLKAK